MKIITATISGFNDDRGVRQTKVENKNTLFSSPQAESYRVSGIEALTNFEIMYM